MSKFEPHYTTPTHVIGKHEWRLIVYTDDHYGRCTEYQFRGPNSIRNGWHPSRWLDSDHWPTYNHNDGSHGGLPKGLTALYNEHVQEIKAALHPELFTLRNDPPAAPKLPKAEAKRQAVLFSGMDCLEGQNDLFETDGAA